MTTGRFHRWGRQTRGSRVLREPQRILDSLRVPRPTFLRSRLIGREEPDIETYSVLARLADVYTLGEIVSCYRAQKSNSLNYLVTTRARHPQTSSADALCGEDRPQQAEARSASGKYVFRRHLLSEETVAHEYQVLSHLERQGFPAPRMLLTGQGGDPRFRREGRAWVPIDGALYSVYTFIKGYRPGDFWWWPPRQRTIVHQAGETLAHLHRATASLEPTRFKWDAYRARTNAAQSPVKESVSNPDALPNALFGPGQPDALSSGVRSESVPPGARWRDGDLYRKALAEIRSLLNQPRPTSRPAIDDFARLRIEDLERLLEQESVVEGHPDLARVVIHGDYAPWNILMQPDGSLFVLDFNAARLDLRIYDIMLATFWFAWQKDRLDLEMAMNLQAGYRCIEAPTEAEIALASNVFCWVMGRSIAERLRTHYLEERFLLSDASSLERMYQMCVWAREHPKELTRGLQANALLDSSSRLGPGIE